MVGAAVERRSSVAGQIENGTCRERRSRPAAMRA
jgi:hypothetical protein